MRTINKIIIHCSATKEGNPVTINDIHRWHVQGRGWNDIGYHYVIELDGTVKQGRPQMTQGAHCYGHNEDSIGVCYVGGLDEDMKPKDTRTPEQKEALRSLIFKLQSVFNEATVHGHNEFSEYKACPCFDVSAEFS